MLIIGHRGAAGLAPENTLEAFRAGVEHDADILEFDVRLTADGIPVVIHDPDTLRTHKTHLTVSRATLAELQEKTVHTPVPTLEAVLDEFFGSILLNIELKGKDSGRTAVSLLKEKYIKKPSDWDLVMFSSFKVRELAAVRNMSQSANLALLQFANPFSFVAHQRKLRLSAVGFHRLHINALALEIAKRLGLFTYAYTVNRPKAAEKLVQRGIDGIVTDNPALLTKPRVKLSSKAT